MYIEITLYLLFIIVFRYLHSKYLNIYYLYIYNIIIYTYMIVNLDCYYKLSSNRLYKASKHLPIYWLEKSVTFSVQLIQAASIQTTLTMMKIDHIPFISF